MVPLTNAKLQVEQRQSFNKQHDDVRYQEGSCKMELHSLSEWEIKQVIAENSDLGLGSGLKTMDNRICREQI